MSQNVTQDKKNQIQNRSLSPRTLTLKVPGTLKGQKNPFHFLKLTLKYVATFLNLQRLKSCMTIYKTSDIQDKVEHCKQDNPFFSLVNENLAQLRSNVLLASLKRSRNSKDTGKSSETLKAKHCYSKCYTKNSACITYHVCLYASLKTLSSLLSMCVS